MKKKVVLFFLLVILGILYCCCQTSISPSFSDSYEGKGPAFITPKRYFVIYAHNWGVVTQEHLETADMLWEETCNCLDLDPDRVRYWPMLLEKVPFRCGDCESAAGCHHDYGHDYHGHISVIGGLDYFPGWDDQDPEYKRWVLERVWRHEMIHQIFLFQYGNNDPDHERESEWECQYPPWGNWR